MLISKPVMEENPYLSSCVQSFNLMIKIDLKLNSEASG